jgi:hypothetical protein
MLASLHMTPSQFGELPNSDRVFEEGYYKRLARELQAQ